MIADTAHKTSLTSVNELNGFLGLDGDRVKLTFLGTTTVHHAASHVLNVTVGVLAHHLSLLVGRVGDLSDCELPELSFLAEMTWA